jgi:hypothetical protein
VQLVVLVVLVVVLDLLLDLDVRTGFVGEDAVLPSPVAARRPRRSLLS